jgi:8-oxo-dGTP pyrophosphatase MutT (NUDIX family)
MDPFSSTVEKIKEKLTGTLPGASAHDIMMPAGKSASHRKMMQDREVDVKLGGVMILLFPVKSKICFPLTLRQDYPGVHSGQISLPGGRMEPDDEDLLMTALRETEEEIGVPYGKINVLGTLSQLYIPPSRYNITPVVGYLKETPSFNIDPREVKELIVADLSHLTDPKYRKRKSLLVRESYQLDAPYFDIHDQVVWGATGMILSEFSHIIEGIEKDGLV